MAKAVFYPSSESEPQPSIVSRSTNRFTDLSSSQSSESSTSTRLVSELENKNKKRKGEGTGGKFVPIVLKWKTYYALVRFLADHHKSSPEDPNGFADTGHAVGALLEAKLRDLLYLD